MKIILTILLIIIGCFNISAQSVGIGTDATDPNAILEIESTDKGILIPRMTNVQRNAITGLGFLQNGLLIYNTNSRSFNYWDGSDWVEFPGSEWIDEGTFLRPADGDFEDVAIGTSTVNAKLTVNSDRNFNSNPAISSYKTSNRSNLTNLDLEIDFFGGGQGINNMLSGPVNATYGGTGIVNNLNGLTGAGNIIGMDNDLSATTTTGDLIGINNRLTNNTSSGSFYSMKNDINGINGNDKFGIYNNFNSSAGTKYGLFNQFDAIGTSTAYAIYNQFAVNTSTETSEIYGMVNNAPPGIDRGEFYGVQNNFNSNSPTTIKTGVENNLNGTGLNFGVRNVFNQTWNATGVANEFINASFGPCGMRNTFSQTTTSSATMHGSYTEFTPNNMGGGSKTGHAVYFDSNVNGALTGMDIFIRDGSTNYAKRGIRIDMWDANGIQAATV